MADIEIREEVDVVSFDPLFIERQRNRYASRAVAYVVWLNGLAAIDGIAQPVNGRTAGPRIRTIVFHGDADTIVHPSNAASVVGTAKEGESIERAEARNTAARAHTRTVTRDKTGKVMVEQWLIHGSGHAWSGGSRDGTYTDPQGPDASSEMLRFFLEARLPAGAE